jgi:hypothetical protein
MQLIIQFLMIALLMFGCGLIGYSIATHSRKAWEREVFIKLHVQADILKASLQTSIDMMKNLSINPNLEVLCNWINKVNYIRNTIPKE